MKLDKAEVATRVAVELARSFGDFMEIKEIAAKAWLLADAMQAEADKRVDKGVPELLTKNKDGSCMHIHTTLNGGECFDCGEDLIPSDSMGLEWQPDWSQAPDGYRYWFVHDCVKGVAMWSKTVPCYGSGSGLSVWGGGVETSMFGYQGDWKYSLRKRPEGK